MIAKKFIFDISDTGLFHALQMGDEKAFREIYDRYWSKLYRYAFNVLHEQEICEDILQEIFSTLWRKRRELEISNLSSYLYQAVKFQIFKHFRHSTYKQQLMDRLALFHYESGMEEKAEYRELADRLEILLSQVSEKRREIFHLSRYEQLSNKEIAEKLQISPQTVKNEISRTLKFLRSSLKNFYTLLF
jgi:RNA polymerase sigma-70 factor (ECF subfamily)